MDLPLRSQPELTSLAEIDGRLRSVHLHTADWTSDIQLGVRENKVAALAWQKAYADGARKDWLRTAKLLRDGRSKYGLEVSFDILARYWFAIGQCIGLREAAGLLQLDRTCSNSPCQHHLVPAEKPMSVCKGCQEVRYCSRECQRRWARVLCPLETVTNMRA